MEIGPQSTQPSGYEPDPMDLLGYVERVLERFSRDRDRLGSVGRVAPFVAPADLACVDI
jgi:hypothetical protein